MRSTPQVYCTERCRKKSEKARAKERAAPIRAARHAAYLAEHESLWAVARARRAAGRRWRKRTLAEWLAEAVPEPNTGCLLWVGPIDRQGYPRVRFGGKMTRVARLICDAPDGMKALHRCDQPACVESLHLYVGTAAENTGDMHRRGRAHTKREPVNGRFAKRE
jgi:hypothetical protein